MVEREVEVEMEERGRKGRIGRIRSVLVIAWDVAVDMRLLEGAVGLANGARKLCLRFAQTRQGHPR